MILTNKDENKTKTYFHPQIIKDDKYQQSSGWYGKVIMRTPYYFMNDDNEKHFVLNLASDTGKKNDDENERKELAKYLFQLRKNNGASYRSICATMGLYPPESITDKRSLI